MKNVNIKYRNTSYICLILLLVTTAFIYLPAINGPYVLDDYHNLVENESLILERISIASIKEAAFSSFSGISGRPISMLSFAANYTMAGNKLPAFVKLTNIFIHLLTGIGIFFLSWKLVPYIYRPEKEGSRSKNYFLISLICTSVWLLHPFFVSTVLYAVQRMAMLSTMVIIYSCVCYFFLRERVIVANKGYAQLITWVTFLTILATLCKENGILLPVFLLLIEAYCFKFKLHNAAPFWVGRTGKILFALPLISVLIYLLHSFISLYGQISPESLISNDQRLLTQTRVLWQYVCWLLFINPEPMTFFHDGTYVSKSILNPINTLFSILSWIIIIILAIINPIQRVRKVFSFCLLWFLCGHLIESTVLPLSLVFEHRNYLPGYGVLLLLTVFIFEVLESLKLQNVLKICLMILLLYFYPAYKLNERATVWSTNHNYVNFIINSKSASPWAWASVANIFFKAGSTRDAMQAINNAQIVDKEEAGYVFSEAIMHCLSNEETLFNDDLNDKLINRVSYHKISIITKKQFYLFTKTCAQSQPKYPVLLSTYKNAVHSGHTALMSMAYYNIGRINFLMGNHSLAVEAFEKLVELDDGAKTLLASVEIITENAKSSSQIEIDTRELSLDYEAKLSF